MYALDGTLCGNGKDGSDEAGRFNQGDRMGILLDLDDGSLRFFKNGVENGPGYPAGSVTGPVARAVQMCNCGTKNRRSQLWAVTKLDLAGYSQIIPGRRQKRPKIQS